MLRVHFWMHRELVSNREGDLGPIYGHQWRHFNAPYKDCETDYTGKGIDQLDTLVQDLKNEDTRYSRRHIISAWNPVQLPENGITTLSHFGAISRKSGGRIILLSLST